MNKLSTYIIFYVNRVAESLKRIGGLEPQFAASLFGALTLSFYVFSAVLIIFSVFEIDLDINPNILIVFGIFTWGYILFYQRKFKDFGDYKKYEKSMEGKYSSLHLFILFGSFGALALGLYIYAFH